jgi:hypothetical protein
LSSVEPRRGVVVGSRGRDMLARLLALAASLRRGTLRLAVAGALAAAAIAYTLLRHGFPESAGRAALTVVALVVVVAPPLVLAAFWLVLRELLELPERLRRLPPEARAHAEELRRVVDEARAVRSRSTIPLQIWRLARLTARSRELLTPYAPVLPLLSLQFLAAVVLAASAAVAEVVVAIVVLVVIALA